MVEFNLGKVNTLDNIKKNLSGIAEGKDEKPPLKNKRKMVLLVLLKL